MQSLGWIRLRLNHLCRCAAARTPSDRRDEILAIEIQTSFFRSRRFEVTRNHVDAAIQKVKRSERARHGDDTHRDWLRKAKEGDNRGSPLTAAGELLRIAVEMAGAKLDASLSVSSTANYAKKVLVQLLAQTVRQVSPLHRVTYLMTVLGARIEDAPWIAFQVTKLLAGERILARRVDETFTFKPAEPKPPEEFRLIGHSERAEMVAAIHRELVGAGYPESRLVERGELQRAVDTYGNPVHWQPASPVWRIVADLSDSPKMTAGRAVGHDIVHPEYHDPFDELGPAKVPK